MLKFKKSAVLLFAAFLLLAFMPPAYSMARRRSSQPKTFPINMKVDFGPAGKPTYDKMMFVEKGTTPKEAVSQVFPVLSGRACCSLKDLVGIDGVDIDPVTNRWWMCYLNGSTKFSPHKKKLKKGDRVEWRYSESSQ